MKIRPLIILLFFYVLSSFKDKEQTWVAIGDSITYLNDHLDETGDRVKKGYLTRVTDKLPNLRYINQGHNGWTSGGIAQNIDKLGLVKADIYSIFLGTNDWWQGRPIGGLDDYKNDIGNKTVFGSFRIIINTIRKLNAEARIILITPMQRNDFVYIADSQNNAHGSYREHAGQSLEDVANAVITIAEYEGIAVVDLYHHPVLTIKNLVNFKRLKDPKTGQYANFVYPGSAEIPFNPNIDEYPYPVESINLTYDGLHPSDAGNTIIANEIVSVFKKIGLAPKWQKYIKLRDYMTPFWKADTIVDECILPLKNGSQINASLLFKARKIVSVKSSDHYEAFVEGLDWNYSKGKINIIRGSNIPFLDKKDLVFKGDKVGLSMRGKAADTFVLYNENGYFSRRQLAVTYIPEKDQRWQGSAMQYASGILPYTIGKLAGQDSLHIVFYGNSIEKGYNTSGLADEAPYMPTWPELVIYKLRDYYSNSQISYSNTSVAGKLAQWGLDSVGDYVNVHHPDLVIIGFGMNDGSVNVTPVQFREQIHKIINSVLAKNPKTEFILIAPMLPNPDAVQSGFQHQYKNELLKLVRPGVALADMTTVHQELLKHKSYQDMTGNNVNHPNDYLARWYAQVVCGLLLQ
ncbi:SGNH/GDSL hydrolase family protein [Sphingobacterium sp.]|uniref:SGNH/GDSL hydrolase family protein n=1 Tax=Sphingobacterium sp. TaxID=341027 RepID=UPI002FD9ED2E